MSCRQRCPGNAIPVEPLVQQLTVLPSKSASASKCNARGERCAVGARHASGTIALRWFGLLGLKGASKAAEARKGTGHLAWLRVAHARRKKKIISLSTAPLNVRILEVALTYKSTLAFSGRS